MILTWFTNDVYYEILLFNVYFDFFLDECTLVYTIFHSGKSNLNSLCHDVENWSMLYKLVESYEFYFR